MKKWISVMLAAVLCLASVSAIAETVTIDVSAKRGIAIKGRQADGTFPNNPRIEGESMTTGLPFEGKYIPILVNIDNAPGALPHWGVAEADIIYEMPIQNGGYTRSLYLYADALPEQAGPVRSARIMHAEMREEWDCLLINYGAQTKKGTSANTYFYQHKVYDKNLSFDGIRGGKTWSNYFARVKIHAAPHNVTAYVKKLSGLVADYPFPERPFLFTDELPTLGTSARVIDIIQANNPSYATHYEYQPESNTYLRWLAGEPFVDANDTGKQLSYENIIVQHCNVTHYQGAGDRPLVDEIGEGNCDIFMGGKYIAGYWIRTGVTARTVFFDSEGNEIKLQRGKTVIVLANQSRVSVTYEK